MTRGGIQNLDKNYKDAIMFSEFLSRYKQRKPVWPLIKFKSHFVNYVYELSDDMVEVRLISTGLVSAFLIESLYGFWLLDLGPLGPQSCPWPEGLHYLFFLKRSTMNMVTPVIGGHTF